MKEKMVENQILWVLTCMNGGIVEKWKKMIKNDLKERLRKYITLEEFFRKIRKEFGRRKDKKVEEEEDIWKGLDSLEKREDTEKEMDGFWNAVRKKETIKKEEMLIVMATMLKKQMKRRGGKCYGTLEH